MNKLMIAVAATIALPAAAFAQATPAAGTASPPAHTGHGAQATDCKGMHAAMSGAHSGRQMGGNSAQADHSKMDHSKMDHSKMAGAHAGHVAAAGSQACHHAAKPAAGAQTAGGHQQHQH